MFHKKVVAVGEVGRSISAGICPDVYVIAMSGENKSLIRMQECGANKCFRKPFAVEAVLAHVASVHAGLSLSPSHARIMILDDYEMVREILELALVSECGISPHNILAAENPEAALSAAGEARFSPDIVITDNSMRSGIVGWELIRDIRAGRHVRLW